MFRQTVIASIDHPRAVFRLVLGVTFLLLFAFPFVRVDVDPESMLSRDEPVRVFHNAMKERMNLHDLILLGVSLDSHGEGVFNPDSLRRIKALTDHIQTIEGVIPHELLSLDKVDAIEPAGPATVRFQRIMSRLPTTQAEANRIRQRARDNPFLLGTQISHDGKALAVYVPIVAKDQSWRISREISWKISEIDGPEQYYFTGLPVAEDTFGVEMFIQMAVSAPLAMLLIGILITWFFQHLRLTIASLLIALFSVVITMGIFVATGNTLHIMSSMSPIFIMPVAVLDTVHILSQFYDDYNGNRRETLLVVMKDLWQPMLFTSLTTAVGFFSLALAPIPPVQVFGIFTGLGMLIAWLLSMTFLPAFIMAMPESALQGFGDKQKIETGGSLLSHTLFRIDNFAWAYSRWILGGGVIIIVIAILGISRIIVNDNPMKWFEPEYPIRSADRLINERFNGSYLVYLSIRQAFDGASVNESVDELRRALPPSNPKTQELIARLDAIAPEADSPVRLIGSLRRWVAEKAADRESTATGESDDGDDLVFELEEDTTHRPRSVEKGQWRALDVVLENTLAPYQIMKQPDMLQWLARLLEYAGSTDLIDGGHAVTNLIRKVNKELHEGRIEHYTIPDSTEGIMETYVSFQSSHDLHRLWHIITHDYAATTLLFQLKSGDNLYVDKATKELDAWISANPPPYALESGWFGLSYINIVWQQKIVEGMLGALAGSGVVVFLMMLFLYRSFWWGILSLVPLTVAIISIYGIVGFIGKDYDMPIAVLSALTLGLSIDFAIHFMTHVRLYAREYTPYEAIKRVFGDPARGIWRNAVIVSLGFTPLLLAPLVPYKTVGYLMIGIMVASAMATFVVLPAILHTSYLQRTLFPNR
uniref:SSD domain-containing protein n=1 Tax=Candidatus Kentrum sp. FW TaxID=2126338 RepID=A0A450TAY7_9GAMM|nr:MAG: hypothetical protein BECKFW1821B_GA0114236_10887 [Candidatus Kentron sp. FW]